MTDGGELSDLDIALYRALLDHPDAQLSQIAQRLGRPIDELDKPLAKLTEIGLIITEDGDRYRAVNPSLAEVSTLGAEELELSARRIAVEARRAAIRQVTPDWTRAARENLGEAAVEVVTDPEARKNVLMYFAEHCQRELLSVAPGRGPGGRADPQTRMANLYSLSRGVLTRALYQHVALRDRATRSYLRDLADHGARIRLAASVPGRSLVIDREVAILPTTTGTAEQNTSAIAVVRERNIVAWIVANFEQLWAEASPLEELLDQHHTEADVDETRLAILRLMSDGEKDEAISRRLSISVRTCRRHIADYMAQVGATSRFQAGVIASRNGHLDLPPTT
ncbi:MAG TPA: helix-turn-helix domain-containing protein [Jatrophihabitantaceae bacterium]|nr:helix-turn-helix domain-containing protein [Jatrophihabitantaceae bacterium]